MIKVNQLLLVKNIGWNTLGQIISRLLFFLFVAYAVVVLTPSDFSKLAYFRNILSLVLVFSGSSLSLAAVFFISKEEGLIEKQRIFNTLLVLNTYLSVFALVILVLLPFVLNYFFHNQFQVSYILSIFLFLPTIFCLGYTILTGFYSGNGNFKLIAVASIISGLISLPLMLLLVRYFGVFGGVSALLLYYFVNFYFLYYKGNFRARLVIDKNIAGDLIRYAAPLAISQMLFLPFKFWLDTYSIDLLGYEDIALFQLLATIQIYVVFVLNMGSNPIIAYLSKNGFGDRAKWFEHNITIILATFSFVFLIFIQDFLFELLNDGYSRTPYYKEVYLFGSLLTSIAVYKTSYVRFIALSGKTTISLESNIVWTSIVVLSYFLFFYNYHPILNLVYSLLCGFIISLIYLLVRLLFSKVMSLKIVLSVPVISSFALMGIVLVYPNNMVIGFLSTLLYVFVCLLSLKNKLKYESL